MGDIESVIDRLRQKGLSIADIYTKLGMERGFFDGRRRSINEFKRRELANPTKRIAHLLPGLCIRRGFFVPMHQLHIFFLF